MLFAAIDFYTLFAQHQRATHILNYYLERVRIEGYLSTQDEGDHIDGTGLYGAFKRAGMELVSIEDCPRQSREDTRVLRNPGNPDDCEIKMTLKIKPVVAPFVSGLFIGEDASNKNYQIVVGGAVLSERIDP